MRVFLALLLWGNCYKSISQTLEIEYEFRANLNRLVQYNSKLQAGVNNAKFSYQSIQREDVEWSKDSNSVFLNIADTNTYTIFTDRADNSIKEILKGFKSKDLFIVNDTISLINWKITTDTKQIGKFLCRKAIGDFRGRRYEAWYTKELPISFGPFKLHGLPGAILEAYDTKKEVIFLAKKIRTTDDKIIFSFPNYKSISRQDYRKYINEKLDAMMKNIASKSDRDFEISAKVTSIKSIEID